MTTPTTEKTTACPACLSAPGLGCEYVDGGQTLRFGDCGTCGGTARVTDEQRRAYWRGRFAPWRAVVIEEARRERRDELAREAREEDDTYRAGWGEW